MEGLAKIISTNETGSYLTYIRIDHSNGRRPYPVRSGVSRDQRPEINPRSPEYVDRSSTNAPGRYR